MSCNNLEQACKESTPSVEQPMYPSSPESMSENNCNQPLNQDQLTIFDAVQKQQKHDHCQKNTLALHKVEQASTEEKNRKRRVRTAFTTEQLNELEKVFCDNNYVCRPTRISTASRLNLSERQVKVWFQNRRMKAKKDKSKIEVTNGKKNLNSPKRELNQLVATDAIKGRRINTSGLSATIHYHQLPPNQNINVKNDGNGFTNGINYQTAYSGSTPNGNIYNESSDVKVYNNNNYYYQAVDGFNNNSTNNNNYGYYVNPNEIANYDCNQYNANTEFPAYNSNLYTYGVVQTADQTVNSFQDIIPSIEFNNAIDGFNFLSTTLNTF